MPRDDGFAIADTATGKLDDPKFRRLWRNVHDEAAMNAAVVLHDAVQLASWGAGDRITAEDAAPFWMMNVEEVTANLQSVGLLDAEGRLPKKAWESWFGAARDRRQKRRDAGQLGGRPPTTDKPNANQPVSDGSASPTSRITTDNPDPSVPYRPSVPSVPSDSPVEHIAALQDVTMLSWERVDDKTRTEFDRLSDQRGSAKVAIAIREVAERIPVQPPAARQVMIEVLRLLEPFEPFGGHKPKPKGMSNVDDLRRATEVV